jgi:membrane-associated phospholipid phosphatase
MTGIAPPAGSDTALGAAMSVDSPRLRPVEWLLVSYLAVVTIVALARAGANPGCWWLVLSHALAALLVWLVTRPGLGPVGRTIREIYPLVLLLALYSELDVLNASGVHVHDAVIERWELALFGFEPSRDWWQNAPSRFWSTLLHGAYLSYYLILSVPAVWLVARARHRAVQRFVLSVMLAFIVCYLFFLFYPVAGPYYTYPRPAGAFVDNAMARMVYATLARGSSYGAAFPSSHVAAALAATIATWAASRRLGVMLAIATALLTVSVVYCQMHYAVDALAGLAVGGLAAAIGMSAAG